MAFIVGSPALLGASMPTASVPLIASSSAAARVSPAPTRARLRLGSAESFFYHFGAPYAPMHCYVVEDRREGADAQRPVRRNWIILGRPLSSRWHATASLTRS